MLLEIEADKLSLFCVFNYLLLNSNSKLYTSIIVTYWWYTTKPAFPGWFSLKSIMHENMLLKHQSSFI